MGARFDIGGDPDNDDTHIAWKYLYTAKDTWLGPKQDLGSIGSLYCLTMTPFKNTKGTVGEGGFRVPCIARWPGHIKPGTVENGIFSGLDWFPTFLAAAGNPNITDQLLKGVKLGDRSYKNHLDGYNQMDLLEGKGPSARHELFYFGGPHLGAIRLDDFKFTFFQQPFGWPGPKVTTDMKGIQQEETERAEKIDLKAPFFPGEHRVHPLFGKASALNEREFNRRHRREQRIGFEHPVSSVCSCSKPYFTRVAH